MGMINEAIPQVTPPLVEATGPDPEKFVPVFKWTSKVVWVWVKKGSKSYGPTEIPHGQVKKYKGKLGYLKAKSEYVAMLDPGTYEGPDDLYPPHWKPGDSLDLTGQSVDIPILAKFKPPVVPKAQKTAKAKAKTPMDPPEGFELPPNYTIKDVTPSHVVATTPDGTDVKWIKVTDHWVHADDPTKDHEPLQAAPKGEITGLVWPEKKSKLTGLKTKPKKTAVAKAKAKAQAAMKSTPKGKP